MVHDSDTCPPHFQSFPSTQAKTPQSSPHRPYHWYQTGLEDQVVWTAGGNQALDLGPALQSFCANGPRGQRLLPGQLLSGAAQ